MVPNPLISHEQVKVEASLLRTVVLAHQALASLALAVAAALHQVVGCLELAAAVAAHLASHYLDPAVEVQAEVCLELLHLQHQPLGWMSSKLTKIAC